MKTTRYQVLLEVELDQIEKHLGKEKMQKVYQDLRRIGDESLSRAILLELIARRFKFWERAKYLAKHLDLVIPFLFRIKP